jgi:hypothetical protein
MANRLERTCLSMIKPPTQLERSVVDVVVFVAGRGDQSATTTATSTTTTFCGYRGVAEVKSLTRDGPWENIVW